MISKSIKITLALFSVSFMWSCFSKKDTSIEVPVETVVEAVEHIGGLDIPWGMAFFTQRRYARHRNQRKNVSP